MHACDRAYIQTHPLSFSPEIVKAEVSPPNLKCLGIHSPQNLSKSPHCSRHIITSDKDCAVCVTSWDL